MKASLLWLILTLAAVQIAPPPPPPPPPPAPPQRGQATSTAPPAATPAPLSAAQCKCFIEVTVKRPSGEPIGDVEVTLTGSSPGRIETDSTGRSQIVTTPSVMTAALTATTDTGGHVSFHDLAEANYTVRAQRDGYMDPQTAGSGSVNPVSVPVNVGPSAMSAATLASLLTLTGASTALVSNSMRQPDHHVQITMIQGGTISGRLQDANRRPLSDVQIGAFRIGYRDGQRTLTQVGSTVQTDDRGEYRLFWFSPGEYFIRTGNTPAAQRQTQGYPTHTYYPGTLDSTRATPVVLKEGQEYSGVDFSMSSTAGVTVSGTIVNNIPGGRVQPNGQVNRSISSVFLVPRNAGTLESPQAIPSGAAGARGARGNNADATQTPFEIRGVPPGTYDFYPIFNVPADGTSSNPRASYYTGRTPIEVGSENVTGVTAVINPSVELKGHVTVTGTPPPSSPSSRPQPVTITNIRIRLQPMDNVPTQLSIGVNSLATLDANGDFTITNVAEGRYSISTLLGAPADAYISDMRMGSQSVYDDGIITIGKGAPEPLEIVISRGGGTVQGTYTAAQNGPIVTIALIPDLPHRQNFRLYKTSQSNAGTFTMQGVAPGSYKLFAWENLPSGAEQNADFLREYEQRGVNIVVSAGVAAAKVQVPVIPDKH